MCWMKQGSVNFISQNRQIEHHIFVNASLEWTYFLWGCHCLLSNSICNLSYTTEWFEWEFHNLSVNYNLGSCYHLYRRVFKFSLFWYSLKTCFGDTKFLFKMLDTASFGNRKHYTGTKVCSHLLCIPLTLFSFYYI